MSLVSEYADALIPFRCFDCFDPPTASVTFTCGHTLGACDQELQGLIDCPVDDPAEDFVCVDCAGVIELN